MNRNIRTIILFILAAGSFTGCNLIDPKEVTPTYVHIDSFTFYRNPTLPASLTLSHQINSVWVFYNDNPIGVYDLPVTFPVMATGTGKLTIAPGISVSGMNNYLARYPFYMSDTLTIQPQPGKVMSIKPRTTYFPTIRNYPAGGINFEDLITRFDLVSGSVPIAISGDSSDVCEGYGSGLIALNRPNDTLSENSWNTTFSVPLGADAYIELNYKGNTPFYIGLQANMNNGGIYMKRYLTGVYASDHWQKFYLAIKDFVAQYQADNYTLFIKAALPADQATGRVLLDNIQVIYFDH
jgi:hypothetical protein